MRAFGRVGGIDGKVEGLLKSTTVKMDARWSEGSTGGGCHSVPDHTENSQDQEGNRSPLFHLATEGANGQSSYGRHPLKSLDCRAFLPSLSRLSPPALSPLKPQIGSHIQARDHAIPSAPLVT